MISLTKNKKLLGYELLNSYSNISHFVTTRHGGCSEGAYSNFNCSPHTADSSIAIRLNQFSLLQEWGQGVRDLVIPQQIHDAASLVINDKFFQMPLYQRWRCLKGVDALITDTPGICICIATADCVPILLYDKKLHVVAAVHAGWKGTVKGIASNVLAQMNRVFGTEVINVVAAIGPSISLQSFEIGEEVYEAFREAGFDMSRISLWNEQTGKHHIDLWEANRLELIHSGVPAEQIEVAGICTYIHHEDFFSARRLGIESGRMLSGIMVKANPE